MFHDLDATLKNLLADPAAPAQLLAIDVNFETPDKNFTLPAPHSAVNLFLYEVKENRELRDPQPIATRVGNADIRRRPPVRVDCSYLVTVWTEGLPAGSKISTEHMLLGQAFFWLNRFAVIPSAYLSGGMVGQPFPPPTLIAQWDGAKNNGEWWNALGISPRPYFTVVVTIALDNGRQIADGPPVVTKELRFKQLVDDGQGGVTPSVNSEVIFEIAGVVRRAADQSVIANAQVAIAGTAQVSTTDADGQFRLSGLKLGTYTLRTTVNAVARNFPNVIVPATVLNAYDINWL